MNNKDEKTAFIAALTETPCKAGQDALLAFPGSIEEYFDTHPRGVRAFFWCIQHGLFSSSWKHLATLQRIDTCAEALPDWALEYVNPILLTPERLAWCKAKANIN